MSNLKKYFNSKTCLFFILNKILKIKLNLIKDNYNYVYNIKINHLFYFLKLILN